MVKDYTQRLDETIQGSIDQLWNQSLDVSNDENAVMHITLSQLNTLVENTIPLIGSDVLLDKNLIKLEWQHFDNFIKSKIALSDPLHDLLFTHILLTLYKNVRNHKNYQDYSILFFDNSQSSIAFQNFVNLIVPFRNPEYPKSKDKLVYISSDQNHLINRTAMLRKDELPVEFFKDCYLKTLRSDTFDFTKTFLITLFNTTLENRALQNLRPTNRGAYIIHPGGTVQQRHERKPKLGMNKNGFTQIQSVTFIDDCLLSPAFGHSNRETLYGIVTHQDDLRISRLLKSDRGTITRPFETNNKPVIDLHLAALLHNKREGHYSDTQLSEFKRAVASEKSEDTKTNEVLARIRFNPHKSFVAICNNTLNSRLLADDFSNELLEYLERDLSNISLTLNSNFKLPIAFYSKPPEKTTSFFDRFHDPIKQHQLSSYTSDMRHRDIQHCNEIFSDKTKRHEHYKKFNFDFLLGLQTLNIDIFLEEIDNIPMAIFILKHGYARVLTRLLRPSRLTRLTDTDPNLLINLFNCLLDSNHIKQNDSVISELIGIEAFDLADILITRTNSDRKQLKFRTLKLVDYLAERGNPRQLMFMGLNEMLCTAAAKKHWVTVRLCLKEIKELDKSILEGLFLEACKQDQLSEIILLNKMVQLNDILINEVFILKANDKKLNIKTIKVLLKLYNDHENHPELGRVLLSALRRQEWELARDLFKIVKNQRWRNGDSGKVILQSTLFYAIKHSFYDLLEDSLKHENSYNDALSESRLMLALDLAKQKSNTRAIALLTDYVSSNTFIDPTDPIKSVCILVFEAYIIGEKGLAEWRLFHYGREINIIPQDSDKKFTYGFKILLTAFERALPYLPFDSAAKAHKLAAKLLTFYQDTDLYHSIRDLINSKLKRADTDTERKTEKKIASKLINSLNPTGSQGPLSPEHLKAVISQSTHLHIWLSELNDKLTHVYSIKYFNNKLASFKKFGIFDNADNIAPEIKELFDIGIFILNLMNTKTAPYIHNDILLFMDVKLGVSCLFSLAFNKENDKIVRTILSIPFVIEKLYEDLLYVIIDNFLGKKSGNTQKAEEDYFCQILAQYPFKAKSDHLETALKHNKPWQIIPLIKTMDDEDIRNPDNFWHYFELWRKLKLSMLVRPKDQSDALAFKLGPIRTRHYTLLHLIIAHCKIFESFILSSSFDHLIKLFSNKATTKILKDSTTEVKEISDLLPIFKPELQLLDDYLSALPTLETLPDEQSILNIYKNLLTHFESMLAQPSPRFFKNKEEQIIIPEFQYLLRETDLIFNPAPIKDAPKPQLKPDPSDIAFYL